MPEGNLLLIVDPQNDFCDLPVQTLGGGGQPVQQLRPSLPVAGADADMQRLGRWIGANSAQIDAITITLDSHQRFDIAHPDFWLDGQGRALAPFTQVEVADVHAGRVRTADPGCRQQALDYLAALQERGRYTHMIWPVHCELGSWGHGVHPAVLQAVAAWQQQRRRASRHILKGHNPWTEHYSALQAEVPDPADASTGLNHELLAQVAAAQQVVVAGEALSHCVRSTVEDLLAHLPGSAAERFTLLVDCSSSVSGFEAQQEQFLQQLEARGARLAQSTHWQLSR